MRTALRYNKRHGLLFGGCVIGAWILVATELAHAQTGDMSLSDTPGSAAAGQVGGLDMDVNPSAPLAKPTPKPPAVRALLRDNVQYTVSSGAEGSGQVRTPTTDSLSPDGQQLPGAMALQPAVTEPISLDHPQVVDTATFSSDGTTVALYGIEGVKGEMAEGLQGYLVAHGNRMTCQAQTSVDFVCLQPDGTDVAEVALVNGAARAKPDAPAPYRDQEAAAQKDRRGIWTSLPPPPVAIKHPTVVDTANLVADGQSYVLDGLQGLRTPFAEQMQGYILQHGDSLVCNPQNIPGHYVCLLGDGTDVAKVALVNGAARVADDAPDAYRVQQAEALNNHRGFWLNQSQEVIMASSVVAGPPPCCAFDPGDDGTDGIAYVAGAPTAVIEGETVFMTYGGDAGWGYYDHYHHWRGAPGRYRSHLEHYHPYGHGLRGYGYDGRREAAFHPGGMHPGYGPGVHPGMGGGGFHPGMGGGAMAHGGAFIRPGPAAGGFHPGGGGFGGAHAAPAVHASSGGGGHGGKH